MQVGQTLYCDSGYGRDIGTIVIARVGRKWAYTEDDRYRVNVATRELQNFRRDGIGLAFGTLAEREEFVRQREITAETERAWTTFYRRVHGMWRKPDHITLADIERLTSVLNG